MRRPTGTLAALLGACTVVLLAGSVPAGQAAEPDLEPASLPCGAGLGLCERTNTCTQWVRQPNGTLTCGQWVETRKYYP